MAKCTTTSYTKNGAKVIWRDLSGADAESICSKASESCYTEITVGKEVVCRSVFIPSWAVKLDRSHL